MEYDKNYISGGVDVLIGTPVRRNVYDLALM
jgi:hypothetical protein